MPEVSRIFKINGLNVLNPSLLMDSDGVTQGWEGLANSISCPRGRQSGEAHFLVSDAVIRSLDLSGPITITCENEVDNLTWQKYYCIRTQAVSSQSSPAHWITLADVRWVVAQATGTTGKLRYNLRNSNSGYIPYSTNSGTPWTWVEVVQQLWALLPVAAGFCPSFGFSGSTPENLVFDGMSAWDAINQVLTAIGHTTLYDPINDAFSIVSLAFAVSAPSWSDRLLWNYRPQDLSVATLPEKAAVFFEYLPTERGIDSPFHALPEVVKVPLFAGAIPGTEYPIEDTTFAWTDNSTQRNARAAEIGTALRYLLDPVAHRFGRVYAGCLQANTNSRISEIVWATDGVQGFTTTLLYKPMPIEWPQSQVQGDESEHCQFVIETVTTSEDANYAPLKQATGTIRICTNPLLIGTSLTVIDHSQCILNKPPAELIGKWAWATNEFSLTPLGQTSPRHWCADNRCC